MIDTRSRSPSPEPGYFTYLSPRSQDPYKHHHVFHPSRRHSANITLDLIHTKDDDEDANSDIVSISDPSSSAPPLSPITIDVSEPSSSTSPTFSAISVGVSVSGSSSPAFNSRPGSQYQTPPPITRPNSRFHELDLEIFNWTLVPDPRLHLASNAVDNRSGESFARKVQADPHLYITPRRGESIAALIRRLVARCVALMKIRKRR